MRHIISSALTTLGGCEMRDDSDPINLYKIKA